MPTVTAKPLRCPDGAPHHYRADYGTGPLVTAACIHCGAVTERERHLSDDARMKSRKRGGDNGRAAQAKARGAWSAKA